MSKRLHISKYRHEPRKPDDRLMTLTNNFLQDFFVLAQKCEQDSNEKFNELKSKPSKKVVIKENKSFHFHYTLPEALLHSEYALANDYRDRQLVGMSSIADTIIKTSFELSLRGIGKDILFLINNFKKQPKYEDYRAENITRKHKIIVTEGINIDAMLKKGKDKDKPAVYPKNTEETTVSFTFQNSKSGGKQIVDVIFHDSELEKVLVKNSDNELVLVINGQDEPKIQHYRHIADINGFLHCLDQVLFLIKYDND
jgi:hypothetical protein